VKKELVELGLYEEWAFDRVRWMGFTCRNRPTRASMNNGREMEIMIMMMNPNHTLHKNVFSYSHPKTRTCLPRQFQTPSLSAEIQSDNK